MKRRRGGGGGGRSGHGRRSRRGGGELLRLSWHKWRWLQLTYFVCSSGHVADELRMLTGSDIDQREMRVGIGIRRRVDRRS